MKLKNKPYHENLRDYEREKQALYSKGLNECEYEQAIKELAKKYKV